MKNTKKIVTMVLSIILIGSAMSSGHPKANEEMAYPSTPVSKPGRVSVNSARTFTHDSKVDFTAATAESRQPETFKEYRNLASKALLTEKEKDSVKELLADRNLIESARDTLLDAGMHDQSRLDFEAERSRLHWVEFLSRSMGWTANPARDFAVQMTTEVVQRDVRALSLPNMVKRSLAGDQIELYQALEVASPSTAQALREDSMGGSNEQLIAYAIANGETRKK
jgi:hypothetical protein